VAAWKLARNSQSIGTVLQDPERQTLGTKVLNEGAFGLENQGLPRGEILERAREALEYLNIVDLAERETFNLSGGEKQKVALAGVLAMRPSILLLDELLSSLDPASAQDTLDAVRSLADEGMTVLMVEHQVEDVLRIHPERIMYMSEVRVRYLGKIKGLSEVVDYHEIKLPAHQIVERAKRDPPLALSFGQQKRISIAAILAMRSRILAMDEPTAGQDYQN
jgi:energy-coupling factor transport system ATP-binding protein